MSLQARLRRALVATAPLALTACAGLTPSQPVPLVDYQPESFDASAFSRHYAAGAARTCEAARRALLSQGYVVTGANGEQVTARKYFQPDAEHHVQLEFRVVCAPEAHSNAASVAFVSGLKDQYVMRKAKESASVGVGGIGSLSLPIEGGMDALVKVSSETVVDRALYERFFELLGEHLTRAVEQAAAAPAPSASASAPATAATPTAVAPTSPTASPASASVPQVVQVRPVAPTGLASAAPAASAAAAASGS